MRSAAAGSLQGVRTFVLGVIDGTKGAKPSYLSPIAEAGGTQRTATCSATDDCFYPLNNKTFAQDLKAHRQLGRVALGWRDGRRDPRHPRGPR